MLVIVGCCWDDVGAVVPAGLLFWLLCWPRFIWIFGYICCCCCCWWCFGVTGGSDLCCKSVPLLGTSDCWGQSRFFFVALFITFSDLAHHTYSCIGTSGKNCQNPHEEVLVKTTAESIWLDSKVTLSAKAHMQIVNMAIILHVIAI